MGYYGKSPRWKLIKTFDFAAQPRITFGGSCQLKVIANMSVAFSLKFGGDFSYYLTRDNSRYVTDEWGNMWYENVNPRYDDRFFFKSIFVSMEETPSIYISGMNSVSISNFDDFSIPGTYNGEYLNQVFRKYNNVMERTFSVPARATKTYGIYVLVPPFWSMYLRDDVNFWAWSFRFHTEVT